MMDPLSPLARYNRTASLDSASTGANRADANKPEAAAAPAPTKPNRLEDDKLELSAAARQSIQEPGFDRAKVEAIKQALKDGQYPLDSRRIAENFIAIENMIKG
jgi:negative regulator of flagellin synthesis FlgM